MSIFHLFQLPYPCLLIQEKVNKTKQHPVLCNTALQNLTKIDQYFVSRYISKSAHTAMYSVNVTQFITFYCATKLLLALMLIYKLS